MIHVQFQFWIPISGACVIPLPAISLHAVFQIQVQFQTEGRAGVVVVWGGVGVAGRTGDGVPLLVVVGGTGGAAGGAAGVTGGAVGGAVGAVGATGAGVAGGMAA